MCGIDEELTEEIGVLSFIGFEAINETFGWLRTGAEDTD